MAVKRLKVKFVGGFLDGEKWTMRALDDQRIILESVLPFAGRGAYTLHDRGADKKVFRFEYRYAEHWSEVLGQLSAGERFSRLRKAVLHSPLRIMGVGPTPADRPR